MRLEDRTVQLAESKQWRVMRSYGGALSDVSDALHYCAVVAIGGKPVATGIGSSLAMAEERALANLESWYRVQTMRASLRLVTP